MKPPPNSRRQKDDMKLLSSWKHKILEWPVNHTVIWGILLGACVGVTCEPTVIWGILLGACVGVTCEPTVIWDILLGACAGVTVNHTVILGILLAACAAKTCEPHCYPEHSSVLVSRYTILHVGKRRTVTIMLKILGATLYKFSNTSDQAPGICASLLTNHPPHPPPPPPPPPPHKPHPPPLPLLTRL